MKQVLASILSIGLLGAVSAGAVANELEKTVEARQAFMKVNAFYITILSDMAKGNRPYDAKLASTAASNIESLSRLDNGAMWPQGSGNDNPALKDKTRAKPEAWTTWPKVSEKHKEWAEAAAGMTKVAGNGLDAMRGGLKELGKGCKGCHEDFRAEKKK